MKCVVLVLLFCLAAAQLHALPAFPGAEGFGANAAGGRGGRVYHVTNLNDSGAGSLRTGVGTANRTIVFDVSGTINLASDLTITKSNLTIAGQTAPGDGICLKGWLTSVQNTHDVIIRYVHCRPGDANCPTFQDDAFHFIYATNCIADHLTASWSIDECLSCTWSTNITVQWCIIGASLNNSCHVKGAHGYGTLLRYGYGRVSYHHDLYIHNQSRNPRPGDNIHLDFVNNVIYDWGGAAGYNANDKPDNTAGFTNALNYIGNYLVTGLSTTTGNLNTAFASGVTNAASLEIYQSGNFIDSNKNGALDGVNTGWGMFSGHYTQKTTPFTAPAITTNSAQVAYERVLAFVGASAVRDAVDRQEIDNVRSQNGNIINSETEQGGWPTLNSTTSPTDTDQDGIPDYWEQALGWDPNVANNNHTNTDGYTDLEWYLNWLAGPHVVCGCNSSVDVNLQSFVGSSTNLMFAVSNGTNGTVSLLSDGHTAHFIATNNYSGLAGFNFNATNPVTSVGFGPVAAGVLISITNAVPANTPPALGAIPNYVIVAGATLTFTNNATDTDQPPQTLTYSMLNVPDGANINSSNGVFLWRPTIAQGNTANNMSMVVSDNGTPILSATQSFSVQVNVPGKPQMPGFAFNHDRFSLTIPGDTGPDYMVQASTNLTVWAGIFTNVSPALPFIWNDSAASNFNQRYYRIQLGP
ncbi:MAG: putative Ig domain-containing protein [Verrucomicrobiota bacterium]|jgi:hypothetical protein